MKRVSFVPEISNFTDTRNVIKELINNSNTEINNLSNQLKTLQQNVLNINPTTTINTNNTDPTSIIGFGLTTANALPKILRANVLTPSAVLDNGSNVWMLARSLGVGNLAPIQVTAGRLYLTVKGTTDAGGVELLQANADADNVVVGVLQFTDANSTNADKRIAVIHSQTDGATANNRGGEIKFYTKANGGALAERMNIEQSGEVNIIGDIDIGGVYKIAGTSGIDMTKSFGLSISTGSFTDALRGTPGAGQSQFTAISTVSLNTESHTWTKGILTA